LRPASAGGIAEYAPPLAPPASQAPAGGRLQGIDIVRGIVMVLMAVDHVRHYAGQPPGGPTPGIFFTRWITHFAAPAFCFLAGTSAFLHGRKLGDRHALSRFLVERGILMVLLELTVIRAAWTFNFDYAHFIQGNVIWVLGWCMIILAALIRLSPTTVGVLGLAVIFGQDIMNLPKALLSDAAFASTQWIWQLLYLGGKVDLGVGEMSFSVIYALVPWIGVMAAGYGFGPLLLGDAERRRRICLRVGLSATALFVIGAGVVMLLHPAAADDPPALLRFLGQRKYPASQLFLLMTLGPTIALLPLAERARGKLADVLKTFGRVPMFYYLLHIPLIHVLAMLVSLVRVGRAEPWLIGNHPWSSPAQPPGYMWSLGLLYAVFVVAVVLLYGPCRWYAGVKARHGRGWLRYF
jgi:uncharacterized membrane protein